MRYIILINILLLIGFNNPQFERIEYSDDCPLNMLDRTLEYKKEVEKIASKRNDTVVTLDIIELRDTNYSSKAKITENEIHVWLIVEDKMKKDSVLIHYSDNVEYFQEINTDFDLENCQLIIETISSTEEEPECNSVEIVKL